MNFKKDMTEKGQVQTFLRAVLQSSADDATTNEGDNGFHANDTADGLPPFIVTATEALALLYLFTTLAVMSLVGLFCLYWKQIRQVRNSKLFELILI